MMPCICMCLYSLYVQVSTIQRLSVFLDWLGKALSLKKTADDGNLHSDDGTIHDSGLDPSIHHTPNQ